MFWNGKNGFWQRNIANYSTLTHDEEVYVNIDEAVKKIDVIGDVERTKESKALIDDAREYFDELSEEEKATLPTGKIEILEEADSHNSVGVTCVYKIKNYRRLNYAKQIIALVAKKFGLEK